MLTLRYDKGTILSGNVRTPHSSWDRSVGVYRSLALHYPEAIRYLRESGIPFEDRVLDPLPHADFRAEVMPRAYQLEALDAWLEAGMRGVVVLPTGSGKTLLGVLAIQEANSPTLVVVPTLDLLEQWRERLAEAFRQEIGAYGGGDTSLCPLTVATYDTAYLRAEELGNRFPLLVFDEVHHLPSPGYSQIAELYASPYRLGLTATYEREDGLHERLPVLVGPKVYERRVSEMAGTHLAPFSIKRIYVDLPPDETQEYLRLMRVYREFVRKKGLRMRSPQDFRRLVMMSGRDREAREALLARMRAMELALNSPSKIGALGRILAQNPSERVLIFTRHNSLVYSISSTLLIPAITHETPKEERQRILKKFREGGYTAVVTSRVLDEGIDVPEASLGIILSGTGSKREFVQRLGRLLRKRGEKKARLIEIVSRLTDESRLSARRRRGV
ncbi:MAG: DEAD/DEAH box helicase family protein [Candidatus Verstraetearchaeota archaeon]|nr:DEAD/DEAH box helicase family protein [Candidatus Verstraetearchaeota archaeon]